MAELNCPNCGKLFNGISYCPWCGWRVPGELAAPATPEQPICRWCGKPLAKAFAGTRWFHAGNGLISCGITHDATPPAPAAPLTHDITETFVNRMQSDSEYCRKVLRELARAEQEAKRLREAVIEVSTQIAQSTIEDPINAAKDFFYLGEPIQKRVGRLAEVALAKGSE